MSAWPNVALSAVASLPRRQIQSTDIASGTMYLGLEHIESGGRLLEAHSITAGDIASTKFAFESGDILYGKLRPYLAKIAMPDFSGVCSTDILPIRVTQDMDARFLLQYLRQPKLVDWANSRSTGANLPRLSPKALADLPIPVPPVQEQRRIAAILDHADALRTKRREALAYLDELGNSVYGDMFVNPIYDVRQVRLDEVSEITAGITKGRKVNGASLREVPYLAVANVQDKKLDLTAVKTIEATEAEIARWRLQRDDLLLTEGGDPDKLGRGSLWRDELPEAIHQNHVFRVRPDSRQVNPIYLNWAVGSHRGKAYFLRSAKQTTGIASINSTQLKAFPLEVPAKDVQEQFAQRISAIEYMRDQHRTALAELDALFASLQSRAFRGEL